MKSGKVQTENTVEEVQSLPNSVQIYLCSSSYGKSSLAPPANLENLHLHHLHWLLQGCCIFISGQKRGKK